jgi:hypothetical protein
LLFTFCKIALKEKRMKKLMLFFVVAALFLAACGAQTPAPQAAPLATSTTAPTAKPVRPTATPTEAPPTLTPEPSATATPNFTLFPTVTFAQATVCRLGPDENYYKVVTFTQGQTTQAQGRSEDSTWLEVLSQAKNQSFTCWIPVANIEKLENIEPMAISVAPPLPVGPSSATASKGVCGRNSSRKPVTIYWAPVVGGGGYYVYRNGENHATVFGGYYNDYGVSKSSAPVEYTYEIQAFNSVGLSKVKAAVKVTMCK